MIVLTDGGSTKCDWVLLDSKANIHLKTTTQGLNPSLLSVIELKQIIQSNSELISMASLVKQVRFYGAGCGTLQHSKKIEEVLLHFYPDASITVYEDTLAAVRSVTVKPAVVCILGTGSNSVFFDGTKVYQPFQSLGYILMDDASGNYFGKKLLRDYFFKIMPEELRKSFKNTYNLSPDYLKENLYKKQYPNAYLASFAPFLFSQPDREGYFYNVLTAGFSSFIKNYVLCFPNAQQVPVHFVGSIAFAAKDILAECLKNHNLQIGKIVKRPIEGLISHYQNQIINT